MLKIDLTIGAFRITSDEHNYILHHCQPKKKGKDAGVPAWSVVGYYGNLNHVTNAMAQRLADTVTEDYPVTQVDDLKRVQAAITESSNALLQAIRERL